MKFLGQGFQKLEYKKDRHTETHERERTHYHAVLAAGKMSIDKT